MAPLERPESGVAETPRAYGRTLPEPPAGCRPLQVRAMPEPAFVVPVGEAGVETEVLTAAGRLVVMQHPQAGPARGEMFDPVSDTWTAISAAGAPRFGSFDEGTGPLGSPDWFAFEDWVVVTWFDGNRRARWSGAIFDARANTWREMQTSGTPAQLTTAIELGTAGFYLRVDPEGGGGLRYDVRAGTWSVIPAAPLGPRQGAAVVQAPGRVIVWGGSDRPDGAIYDVRANAWSALPPDGAPSPRLGAFAAGTEGGMVIWSGRTSVGSTELLRDGGVFDLASSRWTPIPSSDAPNPTIGGIFGIDTMWTGEALSYRELPGENRGSPRRLAFFDPSAGSFWRSSTASHVRPIALSFGRVLLLDPAAPRVYHPRARLECAIALPDDPIFAQMSDATRFAASARIGDELVLWGRIDSQATTPPCPIGAPCVPAQTAISSTPRGVVISP